MTNIVNLVFPRVPDNIGSDVRKSYYINLLFRVCLIRCISLVKNYIMQLVVAMEQK